MYRTICVTILLGMTLGACETLPWEKSRQNPPVELLPENELREITGNEPLQAPAGRIREAPNRRFPDVPVPEEVTEDFQQTYVYESPTIQIGRMVYYSKASVTELAQFYIDTCREEGWTVERAVRADDRATIFFRKPGKRLDVEAQAQGVGRSRKLVVHLTPDEQR